MSRPTKEAELLYDRIYREGFYFCNNCLSPSVYNMKKDMIKCKECGETYEYIWNGFTPMELSHPLNKIGCELEGARNSHPKTTHNEDVQFHGDGSVHFERRGDQECEECSCDEMSESEQEEYNECYHCAGECDCTYDSNHWQIEGEWVTRPLAFNKNFKRFTKIVSESYPEGVNDTCGGHFHISYKNELLYGIAMDYDLYSGLCSHLKSWANSGVLNENGKKKLLRRLEGSSNYCRIGFNPEMQLYGNSDRYFQLNYAYGKHKTMECRILPMFSDSEVYIMAVREATKYIEDWMKNHMIIETPTVEVFKRDFDGRISGSEILQYKQNKTSFRKKILESMVGTEEI